jgi:phage baseplate assembly protein W
MDEGKLLGRGLGFPPRIGPDGRVVWSAGAQNIREAIRIILLTEPQERLLLPEFGGGLQSFLFKPNAVTTHRLIEKRITQELTRWEPRITLEGVTVKHAPDDDQAAIVTINYKLVTTGAGDQVNLTVKLAG